jgi:hypothetical protein
MPQISYTVGVSVEVELATARRRGEPTTTERGHVALSDDQMLFGLVNPRDPTRITHMAYGLAGFNPVEALEHAETIGGGWFWFDAGTTWPEIRIGAAELRRAFTVLGLLDTQGE